MSLTDALTGQANCFYCHEPITGVGIERIGNPVPIVLHPDCTKDLVICLLRDVDQLEHELRLSTDHWRSTRREEHR